MTLEEHELRAALLGRVYDSRDHTYSLPNDHGLGSTEGMLDADTLEHIPKEGYMNLGGGMSRRKALIDAGKIGPGIEP